MPGTPNQNGRSPAGNIFFPFAPAAKLSGWRRVAAALLRRLGPTWRSSPIRRVIQVLCLLVYLQLFFHVAWPYAEQFDTRIIADKQELPLESFLWIDPLVGLSTGIAARTWNPALVGMLAVLVFGVLLPRGFCGYICPLGTLIDGFDWLIGRHIRRFRIASIGRWAHTRHAILAAVLASAACGVLLSGYVSAIPVLTRGLLLTAGRLQLGLQKNWAMVSPADGALYLSVALFVVVFLVGLLSPRFWCKYLCPSGALLSVFNFFRVTERRVSPACIACNKCVEICPFDAIKEDFTTRDHECTTCQSCGGVCPTHSINFLPRWNAEPEKAENDPPVAPRPLSRRGILISAVGGAAAAVGTRTLASPPRPVLRPPGSVPEQQFLDLCIRCGECFKVCPGPVLHPAGFEAGFDALWTPVAVPTHAGCHQDCNFCTLVCPTAAIRPLTIEQKRKTVMGLAVIDTKLCLPHRGERDCQLCYDECEAAGYHAIRMEQIRLPVGERPPGMSEDEYEEMAKINAPVVDAKACVGCGLCEYRCHSALVIQQKLLPMRAVLTVPVGN